ncbi:hypothetical protein L1049_005445 [Liquidambar formosana]|uniref:G protein gamma domain-containing protein n=1 Tax=Liquidambar formosana TaxID=63359 RepID=A0AAP0RQR5_LIQFO
MKTTTTSFQVLASLLNLGLGFAFCRASSSYAFGEWLEATALLYCCGGFFGESMDVSRDSSLPSRSPESPLGHPDLYWKRRKMAKVQVLEREIGLLEEELKSLEGLQPASRCCKELDDFIGAKPDPFTAVNQKVHKSNSFWKRLWGKSCSKFPWICCFSQSSHHLEMPSYCARYPSDSSDLPGCSCMEKLDCQKCCGVPVLSCPHRICSGCKLFLPKCTKMKFCSNCAKASYNPCCLY